MKPLLVCAGFVTKRRLTIVIFNNASTLNVMLCFLLQIIHQTSMEMKRNGKRRRRKREAAEGGEDMKLNQFGETEMQKIGSHHQHSRKHPGSSMDVQESRIQRDHITDGGRVDKPVYVKENVIMRMDGEGMKVRGERLSAEGQEVGAQELEDLQRSCRMISGLQCNSKSNVLLQEGYNIHHLTFKKSPYEERKHAIEDKSNRVFTDHHQRNSRHQTITITHTTSCNTNVKATTPTVNKSSTLIVETSTTTPASTTAYQVSLTQEEKHRMRQETKPMEVRSPTTHYHEMQNTILSPNLVLQNFPTTHTSSATSFTTTTSRHHQNSGMHKQNVESFRHHDPSSQTTYRPDHSTQRGQSIHHIKDRDHSLDRERPHLYSQHTRDPSLHSLDRYEGQNLQTSSSDMNISAMTSTGKIIPENRQLHHRQSSFHRPLLNHPFLPEDEDLTQPLLDSTSTSIQSLLPEDLSQISDLISRKELEQSTKDPHYPLAYTTEISDALQATPGRRELARKQEIKHTLDHLKSPFDLNTYTFGNRPLLPHQSLINLNQSLQDLRKEMKPFDSRIGSRCPSSGYLSQSVTRLFSKHGIGDYISYDQLLTSIRKQNVDQEISAMHDKQFLHNDEECISALYNENADIEHNERRLNRMLGAKWLSLDDEHYASAEELVLRNIFRHEPRRIIRQLLEDRIRLADLEHNITDEEIRRIIEDHTRSYDEEYKRRIDYDKIIDNEIRRLDDDIRKVDEMQKLREKDATILATTKVSHVDDTKSLVGDTEEEVRGRDRIRRRGRRQATSVSPYRYQPPGMNHRQVSQVSLALGRV